MVDMSPEDSHAVPVDLVTIAEQTNVARPGAAAAAQPEKIDIPPPPLTPPPSRDLQEVEPAPVPPMPQIQDRQAEKPTGPDRPAQKQNSSRISTRC